MENGCPIELTRGEPGEHPEILREISDTIWTRVEVTEVEPRPFEREREREIGLLEHDF